MTRAFAALDGTFAFDGDEECVARLELLYAAARTDRYAEHRLTVLASDAGLTLQRDDVVVLHDKPDWAVLDRIVWEVNQLAWSSGGERVLVHGAAVVVEDRAVLLCGQSGAGKSTLAAALCARGAQYLTDEIVAVDRTTGCVDPYPKPLTLRPESWSLVPASLFDAPTVEVQSARYVALAAAHPTRPSIVVLPSVHDGATTWREPARADALVALCGHAHDLQRGGAEAFLALAATVASSSCYEAHVRDVDLACYLVLEAVGTATRAG